MSVPTPFLLQLLASAVAVAMMVGLAAWLGVPRVVGALTEDQVRAVMAEEHPDLAVDHVSIAADGKSAVVACAERTFTVRRIGDGHVVEVGSPLDPLLRRDRLAARKTATQTGVAA